MGWPDDADGDVLRRMEKDGFDFTQPVEIDFNVDFDDWPPEKEALAAIAQLFPDAPIEAFEEDEYIQVKLRDRVSYDLVMSVQSQLTNVVSEFGAHCDSWGVLFDPKDRKSD